MQEGHDLIFLYHLSRPVTLIPRPKVKGRSPRLTSVTIPRPRLSDTGAARDHFSPLSCGEKWWAGQDSNLGRALARVVYSHVLLAAQVPALVAPNLKSRGAPFESLLQEKSRWRDLNPRPAVYKTAALPLSYTGIT